MGWNRSTTLTLLRRMEAKALLSVKQKAGMKFLPTARSP
jgi:hypothetical protein